MNCLAEILALAPSPSTGQPGQGSATGILFPVAIMMVAFYFIGIRPQQQRAKEQAKMLSAIKSGDKVVTVAGIKGTILSIKDSTVSIRSGDAKLEVTKASIMEVLEAGSDSAITTV